MFLRGFHDGDGGCSYGVSIKVTVDVFIFEPGQKKIAYPVGKNMLTFLESDFDFYIEISMRNYIEF